MTGLTVNQVGKNGLMMVVSPESRNVNVEFTYRLPEGRQYELQVRLVVTKFDAALAQSDRLTIDVEAEIILYVSNNQFLELPAGQCLQLRPGMGLQQRLVDASLTEVDRQ